MFKVRQPFFDGLLSNKRNLFDPFRQGCYLLASEWITGDTSEDSNQASLFLT